MIKNLTCVECPMGCSIEVELGENNEVLSVKGNTCPRGKMYAENEVVSPKRVLTTTIRTDEGTMLPVKTNKPIRKTELFTVMEKVKTLRCSNALKTGDVVFAGICDDADLVVAGKTL